MTDRNLLQAQLERLRRRCDDRAAEGLDFTACRHASYAKIVARSGEYTCENVAKLSIATDTLPGEAYQAYSALADELEPLVRAADPERYPQDGRTAVGRLLAWVFDRCKAESLLPDGQELADNGFRATALAIDYLLAEMQTAILAVPAAIKKPVKRSWTQPDLDDAIRKYKAERSAHYSDLRREIENSKGDRRKRLIKDARKVYGRNHIADVLAVKSPTMVTNSSPWQEMAAVLKLNKPRTAGSSRGTKIGHAIALETAAGDTDPVSTEAVRNETITLAQAILPTDEAAAVIHNLEIGKYDDDQAHEIIDLCREQQTDR